MADDETLMAEDDAELEGEAQELEGEGMDSDGDEDEDSREARDDADAEGGERDAEPEGESSKELPRGVRRRLDKLTAKWRTAQRERDEAQGEVARLKAMSGEGDPKVLMAVAEKHGILPELVGAREAEGLRKLERAEARLGMLEDLLDDLEDSGETEATISGKSYTLGELRRMRREAAKEQESLKEGYLSVRKELSKRTAKLLKLGLKAEAAQAKGKRRAEAEDEDSDWDEDDVPGRKARKVLKPKKSPMRKRSEDWGDGRDRSRRFIIENFLRGDD